MPFYATPTYSPLVLTGPMPQVVGSLPVIESGDVVIPIVNITVAPSKTRISRVSGQDVTTFSFQVDEVYQAYKIKAVPAADSIHTAGIEVESGGGGTANTNNNVDVTDDELVNAGLGEANHIIKIFAQDNAGNWSV